MFEQARCLADQGQLEKACLSCEEGVHANPLSMYGNYLQATILMELGQLEEARIALRKVLYLNPDFVLAIYTLGTLEQKLGNRRDALNHFDKAARMLTAYQDSDLLPEAEGLTVGHLKEFINARRKG
jgi:chemotaxis protein methyltransferase CheR